MSLTEAPQLVSCHSWEHVLFFQLCHFLTFTRQVVVLWRQDLFQHGSVRSVLLVGCSGFRVQSELEVELLWYHPHIIIFIILVWNALL